MAEVKSRRDAYADMTRQALLEAGRALFTRDGFAAVTAQDLVGEAGLTRGALYHHFDGKLGLFEAVVDDLQEHAAARIEAAVAGTPGASVERANAALAAFLDVCTDETYRRVVLHDAPVALGQERWQAIDDRHMSGILRTLLEELIGEGAIADYPVELLSTTLFAMLGELGTWVARGQDRDVAHAQAMALAQAVLRGLSR